MRAITLLCVTILIASHVLASVSVARSDNADPEVKKEISKDFGANQANLWFNFPQFMERFHKHYGSALETARRAKLFLARSVAAFTSYVQYNRKRASWRSGINELSDQSDDELRKLFIPIEMVERDLNLTAPEPVDLGFLSKLGFKKKKKRGGSSSGGGGREEEDEVASGGGGSGGGSGRSGGPISEHESEEEEKETRVVYDLRLSDCFSAVKNQKRCGACYAFSMTTMYEYYYCLSQGDFVRFSEQYIVDCGYISELGGCHGGRPDHTMAFVNNYGLELASNRRYVGYEQSCPYADQNDLSKFDGNAAGYYRIRGAVHNMEVPAYQFRDLLKLGRPIFTYFRMTAADFSSYQEGIMCPEHNPREVAHAVLIVGFGFDEGVPYYIATNSFGPNWGEKGYWRIHMECVEMTRIGGIAFLGDFSDFQFVKNRAYAPFGRFTRY